MRGGNVVIELYSNLCAEIRRHLWSKSLDWSSNAVNLDEWVLRICGCSCMHVVASRGGQALFNCPPYPLTRPPEPYSTKTNAWLVDRCSWKAQTSYLRVVRCRMSRSFVQVITYKYTQLPWLHLLLKLVRSPLKGLRPKPRTPECCFCDSSDSQSTVDDYTDCSCSSKFLQIDWIASVSVRHVRATRCLVREPSRHNSLWHA